jgi:diadenosine tetraphosphate (Ap4A) HIT family hydrolase
LAEFPHTWVTTDPDVAIFGYVCVISKVHAVEPFDLSDGEGAAFWREAMAVAAALHQELRPIKMNYEIHGNTLPHLHMHIFPRRPDDPFVGRPIDTKEMHYHYGAEDLSTLRSALNSVLLPPS